MTTQQSLQYNKKRQQNAHIYGDGRSHKNIIRELPVSNILVVTKFYH